MKIKQILKIILKIIVGIILLISVVKLILPMKFQREGMVDPELLSSQLFGQYPSYVYKKQSIKEAWLMDYATVAKAEMDQVALQEKVKYLKDHGWRQVYLPFEDQIAFCHGTQNSIRISYPAKLSYENGMKLTAEEFKNWIIKYDYNYDGLKDWCGN